MSNPIEQKHKDFITNFIHGKYPGFKADVWGRTELEDSQGDSYKDARIVVAGYDGETRRHFDVTLQINKFGFDVLYLMEATVLYRAPQYGFY